MLPLSEPCTLHHDPCTLTELLRATIFHTPAGALGCHEDGGLVIRDGRVAACGDFDRVRAAHPEAAVTDWRGGFLLPGLVDAHVHFPQLRIIGALGRSLLDWLEHVALPEEARMGDNAYAQDTARRFVQALAAHGTTTTALVFGHFPRPPRRCSTRPMRQGCA